MSASVGAAHGYPLLSALPKRFPHIDTCCMDRAVLEAARLLLEELIQRFFLPLSPKPHGLSGFEVADHNEELLFPAKMNLIRPICRKAGFLLAAAHRFR